MNRRVKLLTQKLQHLQVDRSEKVTELVVIGDRGHGPVVLARYVMSQDGKFAEVASEATLEGHTQAD